MQKRWQKAKMGVGVARSTKMRVLRLRFPGCSFWQIWELGNSWACQNKNIRMQVAGNAKTKTVRLRFAKTSTWVLILANPRVGWWSGLPKWEHQGTTNDKCLSDKNLQSLFKLYCLKHISFKIGWVWISSTLFVNFKRDTIFVHCMT